MGNKSSRVWRLLLVLTVMSLLMGVAQSPLKAAEPAKKVLVVAAANQYAEDAGRFHHGDDHAAAEHDLRGSGDRRRQAAVPARTG